MRNKLSTSAGGPGGRASASAVDGAHRAAVAAAAVSVPGRPGVGGGRGQRRGPGDCIKILYGLNLTFFNKESTKNNCLQFLYRPAEEKPLVEALKIRFKYK